MSAYRTDIMKVFVVSILFAVLSGAASSAVAWPGAVPLSAHAVPLSAGAVPLSASYVHSVISPQVKAFSYSTSQYINSAPSPFAFGYNPQISYQSYQIPVSHYYPQIQTYRPIVAPAYFPSTSLLYPSLSPAPTPVAPVERPQTEAPSYPMQGDEDTAVVDSAEYPQQTVAPQPQAPGSEYFPPPSNPAQQPTPANPSPEPPQSLPAADNNDQGLNDEDTISVESA